MEDCGYSMWWAITTSCSDGGGSLSWEVSFPSVDEDGPGGRLHNVEERHICSSHICWFFEISFCENSGHVRKQFINVIFNNRSYWLFRKVKRLNVESDRYQRHDPQISSRGARKQAKKNPHVDVVIEEEATFLDLSQAQHRLSCLLAL